MRIPAFTAETSLGEMKDRYALALGHATENGVVVPQQFWNPCGRACLHCYWWGCYCGPCLIRTHV